jgi:hypothetical protein
LPIVLTGDNICSLFTENPPIFFKVQITESLIERFEKLSSDVLIQPRAFFGCRIGEM